MAERKDKIRFADVGVSLTPAAVVGQTGPTPLDLLQLKRSREALKDIDVLSQQLKADEVNRARAAAKSYIDTIELQVGGELEALTKTESDPASLQDVGMGIISQATQMLPEGARRVFTEKFRNKLSNIVAVPSLSFPAPVAWEIYLSMFRFCAIPSRIRFTTFISSKTVGVGFTNNFWSRNT